MDKVLERTPYDIWSNISRFIPRDVLSGLATVNRTFSFLAAQARYEVVTFLKFDRNTKLLCRNLRYSFIPARRSAWLTGCALQ
jgi:hypothetical protein